MILIFTPPMVKLEANTFCAELKPAMLGTSGDATAPTMVLVNARFSPWSMKNMPRVTRKLGMPVRTTIQPFRNPIASATASATITPTHIFSVNSVPALWWAGLATRRSGSACAHGGALDGRHPASGW